MAGSLSTANTVPLPSPFEEMFTGFLSARSTRTATKAKTKPNPVTIARAIQSSVVKLSARASPSTFEYLLDQGVVNPAAPGYTAPASNRTYYVVHYPMPPGGVGGAIRDVERVSTSDADVPLRVCQMRPHRLAAAVHTIERRELNSEFVD